MKHLHMIFKGILLGTFFGVLIPLIIFTITGSEEFYYTPYGNALDKSLINFFVLALFGVYCVYASYIFDIKKLKMLWRYVIHISVLVAGLTLTGFIVGWFNFMEGFFWALGSFVVTYILFCAINYMQGKASIKKINDKLEEK